VEYVFRKSCFLFTLCSLYFCLYFHYSFAQYKLICILVQPFNRGYVFDYDNGNNHSTMKRTLLLIAVCVLSFSLYAQEDEFETIGKRQGGLKVSGFAGPVMSFTRIGDDFTHMMGGGGGVIINNFFFGGYGMGKTTEITYAGEPNYNMTFGHGGFWLGYTFMHNKAIHPVIHTQLGWGKIGKVDKNLNIEPDPNFGDQVFVVSPAIELEMNFSHFFKLGVGANYSFVYNTGEVGSPYTFEDFAHPGVFMSLKFGWFK
jgi:hypothetical protein